MSTARTTSMARVMKKARDKGKKPKAKDKERRETSSQLDRPTLLKVTWQVKAQGERVLAKLRSKSGGSSQFFREFSGAECSEGKRPCLPPFEEGAQGRRREGEREGGRGGGGALKRSRGEDGGR